MYQAVIRWHNCDGTINDTPSPEVWETKEQAYVWGDEILGFIEKSLVSDGIDHHYKLSLRVAKV